MYNRRLTRRKVGILDIPDLIEQFGRQGLIDIVKIINNPMPESPRIVTLSVITPLGVDTKEITRLLGIIADKMAGK